MIDPELRERLKSWSLRWLIGGLLVWLLIWMYPQFGPIIWIVAGLAFGSLAAMVAAHYLLRRKK